MKDFSKEDIDEALKEIAAMDHRTMCQYWRFGGSDIYFRSDLPTGNAFKERLFTHFGGFTPEISKELGWN